MYTSAVISRSWHQFPLSTFLSTALTNAANLSRVLAYGDEQIPSFNAPIRFSTRLEYRSNRLEALQVATDTPLPGIKHNDGIVLMNYCISYAHNAVLYN